MSEKEFEFSPEQMAEMLLEFNRDPSDNDEDIAEERENVTNMFRILQTSGNLNALAHHLDSMFMDSAFNDKAKMPKPTEEPIYLEIYKEDFSPVQFRELMKKLHLRDEQVGDCFGMRCFVDEKSLKENKYSIVIKAIEKYEITASCEEEAEEIAVEKFGNTYSIDEIRTIKIENGD